MRNSDCPDLDPGWEDRVSRRLAKGEVLGHGPVVSSGGAAIRNEPSHIGEPREISRPVVGTSALN